MFLSGDSAAFSWQNLIDGTIISVNNLADQTDTLIAKLSAKSGQLSNKNFDTPNVNQE